MVKNQLLINLMLLNSVLGFCYWQNNNIVITDIEYSNPKIPKNFDDFKILQISDLHNKEFGKNQKRLIDYTKKIKPHIIVITGDLINRRNINIKLAMDYINGAVTVAPVYFISGNHENWSGVYPDLSKRLINAGVVMLDNHIQEIRIDKQTISLMGISDYSFYAKNKKDIAGNKRFEKMLTFLCKNVKSDFKILLSHRPEKLKLYSQQNINLVFAGHAHGGQFRIPYVGGLFAPNQGVFPKFTSGINKSANTSMVVSRGLGKSIIPLRLFNLPELVVVTLKTI